MIPAEKIIVALDVSEEREVLHLLNSLEGHKVWVKIGMELFYALGPSTLHEAHKRGFKIFLDLKLHDIPTTVSKALTSLMNLPLHMVNVHAAGGSEMMKKASLVVRNSPESPLLLAVTQLTSTTSLQMNNEQRILGDILESVSHYAKLAQESGCHGVVCSPLEVQAIKLICGSEFLTVTPGIRPGPQNVHDQKRVTTPKEALLLGTDYMVIGRPITQASHPREALENILKGN